MTLLSALWRKVLLTGNNFLLLAYFLVSDVRDFKTDTTTPNGTHDLGKTMCK